MTRITPKLQPKSSILLWAGYGLLCSRIWAGFRAIERSIARHREEAVLCDLDRRLLQDIGFEPVTTAKTKSDHASRSDFAPLREIFSWTRFGK
jgi:hypothetical protein